MPVWYANPDPRFQPAMRLISNITKAYQAVVTTTFDHDYHDGQIIRIYVPKEYGMYQIDKKRGPITVLSSDTFRMDIDTRNYDSFLAPSTPPHVSYTAQCVPIGNLLNRYNVAIRNVS